MTKKDGKKVLMRLKILRIKVVDLAKQWDVTRCMVYAVLSNRAKSKHIEEKLRKIGGLE